MQDNFTTVTETTKDTRQQNTSTQTQSYQGNRPVSVLRDGAVTVHIWQNRYQGRIYFNATFERTYTDKSTGDTRSAKSFGLRDIKILQKLLSRAKSEMEKRSIDHLG